MMNSHSRPAANDTNITVRAAGLIQNFARRVNCHERLIRAYETPEWKHLDGMMIVSLISHRFEDDIHM